MDNDLQQHVQRAYYQNLENNRLRAQAGQAPQPTPMKVNGMNLRSLVAMSDDSITTLKVRFAPNDVERTFLVPLDLAKELKIGDRVILDTSRPGTPIYTVAVVSSIDEEADIDPENGTDYNWCFGRLPVEQLARLQAHHDTMFKEIAKVRKQGLKDKIKALLNAGVELQLDGKKL